MNMADAATDEFDHELALSPLSAEQAALYEIDEALSRIENGTYGICDTTGEPISEARLNAVAWTRFSADVERRLDHGGEIGRPRLGPLRSISGRMAGTFGEPIADEETLESPPTDEALSPIRTNPS